MLTPGLLVWAKFVNVPDDAHEVEAVGQQWHWTYRFPGAVGRFGEVKAELISTDNPFGMVPEDPSGRDDVLVFSPEVYVPVDKPVKFVLRSKDVLHDFAVAQFRVKMDLIPGMQTYLWLTPTKIGRFEVLCEELCGMAHHTMRGAVVVAEQGEFNAWLAGHPTYADTLQKRSGNAEAGRALYGTCAACHGQNGEGNQLLNAPKLAGQSDWYLRRQLENYQKGLRGTHEDDTYGRQMAPMAMTVASEDATRNVIAYIGTLPDKAALQTIDGDVCAYCHGADGMGIQAVNAPRAAGMSDWYMERQLRNFRDGLRGSHRSDFYGMQMAFMGRNLQSDEAIRDLVAYINTL